MKIIDDLLSTLNFDAPVRDIRQGPFQTAVLTRGCGLSSTQYEQEHHGSRHPVADAGFLLEKTSYELAKLANSLNVMEASIGMAAINSLLEIDENTCEELNASDLLARHGEGKRVAIVGHFPFIPQLKKVTKELWVIERNPREGDLNEAEAENLVPKADVVGITGTAITNHTIKYLLELCSPRSYVVILGGTAPLSPVLFDYGPDAICGTKVINPGLVLNMVSQGATFRQIKGIKLLTMMRK